ncbi:MAG: rhodanese-like domain-containing protein [Candidatus Lokiarchaeota archaeon]|nr:rhodanese-like domain-containing protein [Candidatus Lokiarchaeota archaeon]
MLLKKKNKSGSNFHYLLFISLFLLQFYLLSSFGSVNAQVRTDISVQEAHDMINDKTTYPDLLVLDVRTIEEYNTNHLYDAILIPVAELGGRLAELALYNDTEIIVYCKSGSRSLQASNTLVANNFSKVFNMLGGIDAWINAGYDYWINENATSIAFTLPTFIISIVGITFVIILFVKRKRKLIMSSQR